MSGHSKWHNIKRKKEVTDAKKSKHFSKMSRLITVTARQGGGDQDSNPSLRLAVQRAREINMPKDNILKAIKKGAGGPDNVPFEEITYEGFGLNGGAIMVSCLTDNKNRTVSEIRVMFSKSDGNLGARGSTAYIFDQETKTPSFLVDPKDSLKRIKKFLDDLNDHEDVQEVWHNYGNIWN